MKLVLSSFAPDARAIIFAFYANRPVFMRAAYSANQLREGSGDVEEVLVTAIDERLITNWCSGLILCIEYTYTENSMYKFCI